MHFRFYASSIDLFLKPDNIVPDLTTPQNWNGYAYVKGNPVNFNDPSWNEAPDKEQQTTKVETSSDQSNPPLQSKDNNNPEIKKKETDANGSSTDLISSLAGVYESIANFFESTGNTISSTGKSVNSENVTGVALDTILSTIGDLRDMFRVGSATGEAIGSGKSGEAVVSAVATDVGRGSQLALPAKAAGLGKIRLLIRLQVLVIHSKGKLLSK